jgi:hypothetical protein
MALLNWFAEHWFDFLQSLGIMGGLALTTVALRTDARAKRVQNLLIVTQNHREIWEQLYSRPKLARVLEPLPDISRHPITHEEQLFVKFLFLHLYAVYRAINSDLYYTPKELAADVRSLLSLPIPREVWMEIKSSQDSDFVAFVEDAFRNKK